MIDHAHIQHISLNARDPSAAAQHLAALVEGVAMPFHPVDGAFVCFLGGEENWGRPLVELYPRTTILALEDGKMTFRRLPAGINGSGAHVNLAVGKSRNQLQAICDDRGIACHWRHWQRLLEVWLDDELMIECVPTD